MTVMCTNLNKAAFWSWADASSQTSFLNLQVKLFEQIPQANIFI